jgi:hypothetical protein
MMNLTAVSYSGEAMRPKQRAVIRLLGMAKRCMVDVNAAGKYWSVASSAPTFLSAPPTF